MAIKKTRNTFEGGIDQDTDEKLVKPNTNRGSQNFTISKDGNQMSFTTLNGFKDISGAVNLNNIDNNLIIYKLTLTDTIPLGQRILEYANGAAFTDLNAVAAITNLAQLANELKTGLSAFNITVYTNSNEVIIVSENLIINTVVDKIYGYDIEFPNPSLAIGDTLWDITKNQVTTPYLTTTALANATQLNAEINSTMPNLGGTVLAAGLIILATDPNVSLSNFNAALTSVESVTIRTKITVETFDYDSTFINLGFKEIIVTDSKRLILLFRKNSNNVFIIQAIYYDNSTNTFIGSGIIYMGNEFSTFINSENIIYTRDSNEKHLLYWVDGTYPDKNITINTSLIASEYTDFTAYISALRNSLYSQSNNSFFEVTNNFIPRPVLYSIINDQEGGKLLPGERVLFTYKLKQGNKLSAIAPFAKGVLIPKNDISADPYGQVEDLGYFPHVANKFSLQFSISGFENLNYNTLVPYVIHYDINNTFKVRPLNEVPLTNGTIIVNYNTSYLTTFNEINLQELNANISTENISQDQVIFKNRRIKANLKDTALDKLLNFDARAYRFNSSRDSNLYDINGNLELTIDGSSPNYIIDKKLDAINKFNDEYTNYADWNTNQQYKFKADGTTIGGEGLNISYVFDDLQVANETLVNSTQPWLGDSDTGELLTVGANGTKVLSSNQRYYNSHRNPITLKGFQGGEVYRFFIYFWKEDKPTLAQWIGDIKFPENTNIARGTAGTPGNPVTLYQQNIIFSVNTSSFLGDASAFSIGYTPRDIENSSVIFTAPDLGMHLSTTLTTNNTVLFHTDYPEHTTKLTNDGSLNTDDNTDFVELSKIKCFPFDLETAKLVNSYGTIDELYLKEIGICSSTLLAETVVANKHQRDFRFVYDTGSTSLATPNQLQPVQELIKLTDRHNITDNLTLIDPNTRVLNSTYMAELATPAVHPSSLAVNDYVGDRYTKTLIITENNFDITDDTVVLFSLRKKITSQYGGAGYVARQKNEIILGSYTKITGTVQSSIPEGDAYACLPDIILDWSRVEQPDTTLVTQSDRGTVFPIESRINFHTLYSENENAVYDMQTYYNLYKSINAIDVDGVFNPTTNLDIPFDISNKSVNVQNNTTSSYPFTISISEKRFSGESSDSWLNFFTNNTKIIDPSWGSITKVIDQKDRLFVFQEHAVSQQYVEQVQQQVDDISEISLGTGDVAGQHIYVLKNIGIQNNNQAIQIQQDVIFQDIIRNKLYTLNQGELFGISNLLIKDDTFSLNRTIIYDRQTNIVFIPNYIESPTDSFYITYDNNIKKLITDKSFNVNNNSNNLYFTGLTNMVSIVSGNFELLNKTNSPTFTNLTSVSFIVNPESEVVKTFDTLLLNLEMNSIDSNNNRTDAALVMPTSIRVENQYQDTGTITCTASNTRRFGRNWRFTIPRNNGDNTRIRDYWAKVTVIFPANYEIILKEVITSYRNSNLN